MIRRRALLPGSILAGCFLLIVMFSPTAGAVPAGGNGRLPAAINYAALGDSLTSAAYAGDEAYAVQYKRDIDADLHAVTTLTNLGIPGWTSTDLLHSVRNDQHFRDAIAEADIITIMIGAVDFFFAWGEHGSGTCGGDDQEDCMRALAETFRSNLVQIVSELQSLNRKTDLVVRLSELFYPAIGDPTTDPANNMYRRYLQQMNQDIHTLADQHEFGVARVYRAFHGDATWHGAFANGLILPDAVHPTVLGFSAIAGAFRELGYAPLDADAGR